MCALLCHSCRALVADGTTVSTARVLQLLPCLLQLIKRNASDCRTCLLPINMRHEGGTLCQSSTHAFDSSKPPCLPLMTSRVKPSSRQRRCKIEKTATHPPSPPLVSMHSWQCPGDGGLDSLVPRQRKSPERKDLFSELSSANIPVGESSRCIQVASYFTYTRIHCRGADYRDDRQFPYQDPWVIP